MGEIDQLSVRELVRWGRYWAEEPWGAHRDNMHAAMLAVEVLRPHVKEGGKLQMADFMFEHPEDRSARAHAKLIAQLQTEAIRAERAERKARK